MHAFIWEVVRALTKLGIAIAASRPMMATTIMISTRVKPDLFEVLTFIMCLAFFGGVNKASGGFKRLQFLFTNCLPHPRRWQHQHLRCQLLPGHDVLEHATPINKKGPGFLPGLCHLNNAEIRAAIRGRPRPGREASGKPAASSNL